MSIYDFKVMKADGTEVSMADYKGKVLLSVNTATGCGFTPQYEPLQELYDELQGKDFEIIDIPCNQFGEQAPGSDEEITPSARAASASPSRRSPRQTCVAKRPSRCSAIWRTTPRLKASA